MRPSKKLIRILREIATLIEEEAERNPSFAERVDAIVGNLPHTKRNKSNGQTRTVQGEVPPDVFVVHQAKGEEEFRFWLRSLDTSMLKAIIKINGFDPGKDSQRWNEPDKFVDLIANQVVARLRRGSAFLTPKVLEGGT